MEASMTEASQSDGARASVGNPCRPPAASHDLKLEVRGAVKRYGSVVSVAGADLAMRDGEFLTLLGPSGSGKTTLLSLIAGLIEPDEGEIWIDGRNATRVPKNGRASCRESVGQDG